MPYDLVETINPADAANVQMELKQTTLSVGTSFADIFAANIAAPTIGVIIDPILPMPSAAPIPEPRIAVGYKLAARGAKPRVAPTAMAPANGAIKNQRS